MLDYLKLALKKHHYDGLKSQTEFTKTYSDILVSQQRISAFNALYNLKAGDELPLSFAFIAAFPCLINTFASKQFKTSAIGLIHLTAEFNRFKEINYTQSSTVKINVEPAGTHPKGTLLKVTSYLLQNQQLCIKNTNLMLKPIKIGTSKRSSIIKQFNASEVSCIEQRTLWRYARVSGDYNPIHLSRFLAKLFAMRTAIVHGMYLVHFAVLAQQLTGEYLKAEFKKPCAVGTAVGIDCSTSTLQVFSNTTDLHLSVTTK